MFFLAISMVGTDFSMISQLFPHRARTEIKVNIFKKKLTGSIRYSLACVFNILWCLTIHYIISI